MGFDFKTPWELAELEKERVPYIASLVGSSSITVHHGRGHCSVDLKLGSLGNSEGRLVEKDKDPDFSLMESSSSGSSKRARALGNGTQLASCLVDGCTADLSKCRDYHRRHKVCELHSKTPKVTIGGHEQRFCQQCSRFHSLVEFDEGKRSCRKRLDGHNRRRRKPQPDSLSVNSGRFLSHHQGTRFIPFSSSQIISTSAAGTTWAGAVKAESDLMPYNNHLPINFTDRKSLFPGSISHSYKGGKQFPFLQGSNSTFPGASVSQPFLDANSSSANGGSSQKMFSDGLNRAIDSNRALSLLSSPPTATREIGFSHMVQPDSIPLAQSLIPSLHYNGLRMEGEPVVSDFASVGSNNASLHCLDMFQIGPDGSPASGPHQTLSFSRE